MSYRGRGRGGYYNNNGNRSNFGGNPGMNNGNVSTSFPMGNQQQDMVQVEIQGWNNASPDDVISFLSRKTKIGVLNHSVNQINNAVTGFVRSRKDADELMNWNGVKFAGQSLKMTIVGGANNNTGGLGALNNGNRAPSIGGAGFSSTTVNTVESLKEFLKARYNPQAKVLDLSSIQNDQLLVSRGLLGSSISSSTSSKMFMALMKLASQDPTIVVETVNLSNNSFTDTFNSLSLLGTTFPQLLNLSLESNRISRVKFFETWKSKFTNLRELVLLNNPVQQATNYQFEIVKIFPKLILLDGQILRDEAKLQKIFTFPVVTKQMFFETPDIQGIATSFVSNYMNLWDTNRQELMTLYSSPESQFSIQVDSTHPAEFHDDDSNYWSYYMPNSRNLARIANGRSRMTRLHKGAQDIFKVFQQIPKTKHALMESPHLFSMESYSFPQVQGIIVAIHGEFDEVAIPDVIPAPGGPRTYQGKYHNQAKGTLTKRSFDRTFVIVQAPDQSMLVASDLLLLRSHATAKAWNGPVHATQQQGAPVNPGNAATPSIGPATGPSPTAPLNLAAPSPTAPGSANGNAASILQQQVPPDILSSLSITQQQLLARIFEETKLNAEFSMMLCQQSNWDYQACINSFNGSKANIPPNAYQQ